MTDDRRVFLGWETPVVEAVADWLLANAAAGILYDLSSVLIATPTAQAGRRLREMLALRCSEQGAGVLSARTVTPAFFLRNENAGNCDVITSTAATAVWSDILLAMDPADYAGLFPVKPVEPDYAWAMRTAEMLESLRRTLADAGHRIGDVPDEAGATLEEPARWQAMAALEKIYLERVKALELEDSVRAEIKRADAPEVPEGIERVIVAAVPAPTPLMVRALAALEKKVPVQVLVHAPEASRDAFDDWGRPLASEWCEAEFDIPGFSQRVQLAADPAAQAQRVVETIAEREKEIGPADVAIGVPDRAVIPFLESALGMRGLPAFDPDEKKVGDHALFRLLQAMADLFSGGRYEAFSALLRHPDFLLYLEQVHDTTTAEVLTDLDEFQNTHLPLDYRDVETRFTNTGYIADAGAFGSLAKAVAATRLLLAGLGKGLEDGIRGLLHEVYRVQEAGDDTPEGREFEALAHAVSRSLRDCADALTKVDVEPKDALALFLERLADEQYPREREGALLDLEGWLELPWNNAPLMIVTGMNEGSVPDTRLGDIFVPDSLRKALGLPDDAARLARDVYLMKTLLTSREKKGHVYLVLGKRSAVGDPLKPSRLFFRCPDADLLERAERLLGDVAETRQNYPFRVSFMLKPEAPLTDGGRLDLERISATKFRTYLACPFRFYLSHVLRMESLDDEKAALDAADFGHLVHEVLEVLSTDDMVKRCADEAIVASVLRKRLDDYAVQHFGKERSLPVTILIESARQRLGAAARVHAEQVREGWEVLLPPEKWLTTEFHGMTIGGMIDRVDRHRETGVVRVIDYKTSDAGKGPRSIHVGSSRDAWDIAKFTVTERGKPKEYAWKDLQLPLYRLILEQEMDISGPVEVAFFNLPRAVSNTAVDVWEDFTDEYYEAAKDCAARVIDAVKRHTFWPPAEKVQWDDFETLFYGTPADSVDGKGFEAFLNRKAAKEAKK